LDNLAKCIALLRAQTLGPENFEVIVADNNSSAGIEAVREVAGPFAHVVPAPVQGAGPARNAGVAASAGTVVAFLDSDCSPAADWLARGVEALDRTDMVGGRVDIFVRDPARPMPVEAFEL